jgi:DNA-binding MarR family transcriptional regulator
MANDEITIKNYLQKHFLDYVKRNNQDRFDEISKMIDQQQKNNASFKGALNVDWYEVSLLRTANHLKKAHGEYIEMKLEEAGFSDLQSENIWPLLFVQTFEDFTLTDFAKLASQTRANITLTAQRFEDKGYIKKVKQTEDKKSVHLITTEKWDAASKVVYQAYKEINDAVEKAIGAEALEKLSIDMLKISDLISEMIIKNKK